MNSYLTCPRAWYLQYVLKEGGKQNFFSQYGSYVHEILEKYGKGELALEELVPYYDEHFDEYITVDAPYNKWKDLREDYYYKARNYLVDFNGFDDETVGIEYPVNFPLKLKNRTLKMCGYIDRVSKLEDGTLKITDYKSRKNFKNKEELDHYLYQLYLYSIPLKENNQVTKLTFDMFKENSKVNVDYDEEALKKTIEWVDKTVEMIYNDNEFKRSKDVENDFFCKNLCSCYESCYNQKVEEDEKNSK